MKKSKKLLLGAISGMALMAIATGSVATMAWFTATQSVTITADDTPATGSISVGETSASVLTLSAEIHFTVGGGRVYNGATPSHKDLSSGAVKLTTWADVSGDTPVINASADANDTLVTGAKRNAASAVVYSILGADDIGWVYFPVKAYIEDTSTSSGNTDEWRTAINAAGSNFTGKATFDYTNAVSSGNLLLGTEVYFYKVDEANPASPNSMPTSFNKSAEAAGSETGGIEFTVSAKSLINDYEGTTSSHANELLLGYLVVRFEGSKRDHTPNTNYVANISATSTII